MFLRAALAISIRFEYNDDVFPQYTENFRAGLKRSKWKGLVALLPFSDFQIHSVIKFHDGYLIVSDILFILFFYIIFSIFSFSKLFDFCKNQFNSLWIELDILKRTWKFGRKSSFFYNFYAILDMSLLVFEICSELTGDFLTMWKT